MNLNAKERARGKMGAREKKKKEAAGRHFSFSPTTYKTNRTHDRRLAGSLSHSTKQLDYELEISIAS